PLTLNPGQNNYFHRKPLPFTASVTCAGSNLTTPLPRSGSGVLSTMNPNGFSVPVRWAKG
ncbi:MAG: hypothetical protein ACUVUR_05885, partial [bacterium]